MMEVSERGRFKAPDPIAGERHDLYLQRVMRAFEDHVNQIGAFDLMPLMCDCNCGTTCPQGRTGSEQRCTIYVRRT